ncbi:sigma 54-interacting transcriptional regulator [Ferviditalea candida]|uniref:HTH-type transcriptional regulatory protein TyrR n=1 Tax=Ferviditalea candida TaxID=3108399 RepID=A0ABU5ZIC5_9BACL|nr:sigma 54-interacting transcriptional regulator [Paenibacillaceae bacterium T2]
MISARTAYTAPLDVSVGEVWSLMSKYNETFIFITDPNEGHEIVGYIRSTDIMPLTETKEAMHQQLQQIPFHTNLMFIPEKADVLDFFKVFGEEVVVIVDETERLKGYLQREDILYHLLTSQSSGTDWIRSLLNSIPMGIIITDMYGRIQNFSSEALRMLKISPEQLRAQSIGELLDKEAFHKTIDHGETILNFIILKEGFGVLADFGPIRNRKGSVIGAIIVLQDLPYIENMAMELEYVKNLNMDLQAILSSIYDQIIVIDDRGVLLRHSGNLMKDFIHTERTDLVGINLMELEGEGSFFSSIVKMVIDRKKKISVTQETYAGKTFLAVGNPVFNERGKLERIVIALRDITENLMLKEELRHIRKESEKYKKELENLRNRRGYNLNQQLVYGSEKIEKLMKYIKKISNVSSTVLLTGESGVGKEVFARAIHELGPRRNKPFIKVNCGAIPETLLESELFGYEKGAFTGANSSGKQGFFQLADNGILFLDEIGELPLNLQVKLLRVLQEREVTPVGGTKIEKIDVQIIAATNKDLEKMVDAKLFREDLFYRLNVLPVHIPSLRERPEDIPYLSLHFLQIFNEKYQRTNQLSQDALDLLESYSWPGNVRELQNIIERISVTAEDELIGAEQILPMLKKIAKMDAPGSGAPAIIPLKEAIQQVEENLIEMAMNRYSTTLKAAEVLGVSQSTVSRKYNEILNKRKQGERD